MTSFKKILPILGLLLTLPACATTFTLSSDPIEGQVLEEGTNKPIRGAIVVVRWQGHLGYTGTVCYHVETATTDAEGKYRIPAWSKPSPYGNIADRTWLSWAHKLGYQYARVQHKGIDILQPFTGTGEERFKYLERVFGSTGCGTNDGSNKNSIPFMKALYDEAKSIAQTQEEKRMLEFFLYAIEKLEIGFERAEKRHLERVGK